MPKRDLYSNHDVHVSLAPEVRNADVNGASVDLRGSDSAMVIVNVGAEGVALSNAVTIAVDLEESDDNATWNDVAGKDIQGSESGTLVTFDSNNELPALMRFGYIGYKRYIRAVWNVTGAQGGGTPGAVSVVRGNLYQRPAA